MALEIATWLGDTLVELRYCRDVTARPSRWPRVFVVTGIACTVLAAIAVGVSVATAADNDAAFRAWIESRPAWAFRPVPLSPVYDALAFGGFASAIVAFVAALAWSRPLAPPPTVSERGTVVSRVELVREDLRPRFALRLGPVLGVAGSLALHAGLVLLAGHREEPVHIDICLVEDGDVLSTVDVDDAPRHASDEEVDESDNMPRTSMQLPTFVERAWPDPAPELSRDAFPDDPALARTVAIATLATGAHEAYAGLLGSQAGEMSGGFGFGRSTFEGGCCGGTGWGTIGTGRYGTIGHGSGRGSGYSLRGGRGGMRGRTASVPTVTLGQPTAQGDLDRAVIRRYIKRNIQKVTYCYEKQLLAQPTLAGTLVVELVISPQGSVIGAGAKGVDDTVASCIADVVRAIEFPRPRGGTSVGVRYPMTFRPAG